MITQYNGVGAIITNSDKSLFYVQEKDEEYRFKEFIGCSSFFGGGIEKDDKNEFEALKREINEELPTVSNILFNGAIKKVDAFIIKHGEENFTFTLFEIIIPNEELLKFENISPTEGRGKLLKLQELQKQKWVWNLQVAINKYLEKVVN
ncbi:NUDIX hydrolase [Candidatus Pacearchaeota archaeon]|nr:NUDIX hydrolase [Candidatus Pacearchaeota archaeon]